MRHVTLLIFAAILLFPCFALADDLSGLMPEAVGDMHRIQLITGADAQAEVDKLHGKPLPAEASVLARYSTPGDVGSARPAEVWVSRVESESEARRQTGLMVHMMFKNPRSPFKNPKRIEHRGIAAYRFEGMGQAHYIWFTGDLVYWVSAGLHEEAVMLDAFCK